MTAQALQEKLGTTGLAGRIKTDEIRITTSGDINRRYALLEPIGTKEPVPVVLFFHGWDGGNPKFYGAWLDYLARQGHTVVFVGYQTKPSELPTNVTEIAHRSLEAALAELRRPGHVQVDLSLVVSIGYSMGASVALNLAVSGRFPDLPRIKGLVLVNPADGFHVASGRGKGSILHDVEQISQDTRLVVVVSASDPISSFGRTLFLKFCELHDVRRNLVVLQNDTHGPSSLKADHLAPSAYSKYLDFDVKTRVSSILAAKRPKPWATPGINALDVFGFWKLADGVIDSLRTGPNSSWVFQDDRAVSFSGLWSDGMPIRPAEIVPKSECKKKLARPDSAAKQ